MSKPLELTKKELIAKRKQNMIDCAISSWTLNKNGIYRSWEIERYTPEYCQSQIDYFKNLKL